MGCLAENAGTGLCSIYKGGSFCIKHYAQKRRGIIDANGNKIRDKIKEPPHTFSGCIAKNSGTGKCSRYIKGRFCIKHNAQYYNGIINKDGKKLRNLIPINSWKKKFTDCIAKNAETGKCCRYKRSRFCNTHWVQYKLGIIDINGKKLREPGSKYPVKNKICIAKHTGPCGGPMRGRLCNRHYTQKYRGYLNNEGDRIKKLKNPHLFHECLAKNAGTGPCSTYRNSRFCGKHQAQYKWGIIDQNGKRIREKLSEMKCGIPGCSGSAGFRSGLCQVHYDDIIKNSRYDNYPSLNKVLSSTMPIKDISWNKLNK